MTMLRFPLLIIAILIAMTPSIAQTQPQAPKREFRGAWKK